MLNGKVVVWFQGPSFLSQEEKHWPNQDESVELAADDPELKKETKSFAAAVVQQEDVLGYLDERISNWSKFKRITALLLCYKRKCFLTLEVRKVGRVSIPLIVMIGYLILKN